MDYKDLERVNAEINYQPIKTKDGEKKYAPVNERIKAFRKMYPEGRILTDIVAETDTTITVSAAVYKDATTVLATGHAKEFKNGSWINKSSYLENCETSAIGRALGMLGIGIDAAICSADELQSAEIEQDRIRTEEVRKQKIGIDRAIALLEEIEKRNINVKKLSEQYGVERLEDLTEEQHRSVIARLNDYDKNQKKKEKAKK